MSSSPTSQDPLARVLSLGSRRVRTGMALGLAGGLLVHAAAASHGHSVGEMWRLRTFAALVRADIRSRVHMTFDIEREEPKPPEPEPPPPEPEPEELKPEPEKLPEKEPEPPPTPPPAAAEAAKVLTAEADPNAPLDLTGFTIVTGNADRSPGGLTASSGTSKRPVFDRAARADGEGEAKKPTVPKAAPVAAAEDLSRPPQIAGGKGWNNCPWPAEADVSQTNYQRVPLLITVGPDGNAQKVVVLKDDGLGFGANARACALRERFAPALDKAGKPTTGSFKVNVTFRR